MSALPWWSKAEPHNEVVPYASQLMQRQRQRTLIDYLMRSVYEGRPYRSLGVAGARDAGRFLQSIKPRLKVTKSVVDTMVNRLIKRRALPIMTATDADWSLKTRAKRLSSYVRALISGQQFDELSPHILWDAEIVGTGCVQVVETKHAVEFQRVPRDEIVLEDLELKYNAPRQLHRRRRVSRYVLLAKYKEHAAAIRKAPAADRTLERAMGAQVAVDGSDDQVDVWESWHLRSSDDADDGLHVMCIDGATLMTEEWCEDLFPVAFLHGEQPPEGFWGTGTVEELTGLAVGIDRTYGALVDNADANRGGYVFIRRGDNVAKGHLGGAGMRAIETSGASPPQFFMPPPFNPASMQFLEWQKAQAYELTGVSQASASSKSPLGNNASGVALDNMMDIESDRFSKKEHAYANFRLQVARCIVAVNKAAAARNGAKRVVAWADGDVQRSIDWKKVDMDRDQFAYKLEPTNFIPESRAGKLSAVNELSKAGVISDPSMVSSLFDEPDLARMNRLQNAPMNAVEALLERAADLDKEPPTIDPHLDLALIVKVGKQFYSRLIANEAGDSEDGREAMSRVRDFIGDAQALIDESAAKAAKATPPPADPMAGMPPGGMPPDMMQGVPTMAPAAPPPGMPGGLPMPMPGAPQ